MPIDFLRQRSFVIEDMDNFDLAGVELDSTLSGLSQINKYLGNSHTVLNRLKPLIRKNQEPLTIIDLGCGGADLLLALAEYANSQDIPINLIGIDGNPNIIKYNDDNIGQLENIKFLVADILDAQFELPDCDILISSHFVYHFTDEQLTQFLQRAKIHVKTKIIFSELQRSVISYRLFQILAGVLRLPRMINGDGLKAISRSFRSTELANILQQAEIGEYRIQWKWAFRYLIEVDMDPKSS